jgi:hypothetical protein
LTTSPSIPSIHAAAAVTQLTSGSLIVDQNVHLVAAAAAYVVAVLELQRTDACGLAPFMDVWPTWSYLGCLTQKTNGNVL